MNWDWRNRGPEALVGGATGLAVVAVYIIARAIIRGASDGEWLNFAGVIVGVALTAGVTLALHHYQERQKLRPFKQRLRFAIDGLEASIEGLDDGDLHVLQAKSREVSQINDELRLIDFQFVRSINDKLIAFNSALGRHLEADGWGHPRWVSSADSQAAIDEMYQITSEMMRLTK